MDGDPLCNLFDLSLNGAVPLDEILLALASDYPSSGLVFKFEAVFVHFI